MDSSPQPPFQSLRRGTAAWALTGIGLVVAAVFLASSDAGKKEGLRYGDLLNYHVAAVQRIGARLRAGQIPFWDPEAGCGVDQFVSMNNSLCYPPFWLAAWLGPRLGLGLLVIAHLLLAGGAWVAWLRCLNVRTAPALLGAAALVFGLIGESWWPPMLYTLAWTPVAFLLVDLPGLSGRSRGCALAVCLALQLLAGFPQYFLYSLMLLGGYVAIKAIKNRSVHLPATLLAGTATAMLLAAVQLLPTYLFVTREGFRRGPLEPDRVHSGTGGVPAESFQSQLSRVVPNVFDNSQRARFLSNRFSYGYLGIVVPFAVGMCLICRPTWRTAYFALAMGAGWYLCVGYTPTVLPLYDWLAHLMPWFGSFREPDRLLLWMLFGVAALVGLGAERIWPADSHSACRWRVLAVAVLVATVQIGRWASSEADIRQVVLWLCGLACVVLAALLGRLKLGRKAITASQLAVAALAVTVVDMVFASGFVCPYIEFPRKQLSEVRTATEVGAETILTADQLRMLAAEAGRDRLYIAAPYAPLRRPASLPAFRTLAAYEPFIPGRHAELDEWFLARNLREVPSNRLWDLPVEPHMSLFDVSSIRVVAVRGPIEDAAQHGWEEVTTLPNGTVVYRNRRVIERASLWEHYQVVSPTDALDHLVSAPDQTRRREVLLEQPPGEAWRKQHDARADTTPESQPIGSVKWLLDEPEHVRLDVEAIRPALLLLSDTYMPGWRCWVDDQLVHIHRANYLFRAIEVLPGRHVVEFRYRTAGVAAGAIVSAAGIAAMAMVVALAGRRRRRPQAR